MITLTGYIMIPLGLALICLSWRYAMIGLLAFSLMTPAAVINIGHTGLQPGFYMALLIILRTVIDVMQHRLTLNRFVIGRMSPTFSFVMTAFVVLFIALCFFQGKVASLPGSAGFKSALTHPFRLGRENYNQAAYLLVDMVLVYCIGHHGARIKFSDLLRYWDIAMVIAIWYAIAVCIWQLLSLSAGVPFPGDFFYSNAGYNRADSQTLVGLFRINGPFEEPSAVGYNFTGFLLFSWLRYRLYPTMLSTLMIAGCLVCMMVSTSTTAYLGIALCGSIALLDFASGRIHLFSRDMRLSSGQLTAIAIVILGTIGGAFMLARNADAVVLLLKATIFQKNQSTSFHQRQFADLLGLRIFVETYGIGLGLGSHRPNSMIVTLLSNVGVIGTLIYLQLVFGILQPFKARLRDMSQEQIQIAVRPFQWSIIGLLLIHCFSNPGVTIVMLWCQFGGIIALQAALSRSISAEDRPLSRFYATHLNPTGARYLA